MQRQNVARIKRKGKQKGENTIRKQEIFFRYWLKPLDRARVLELPTDY